MFRHIFIILKIDEQQVWLSGYSPEHVHNMHCRGDESLSVKEVTRNGERKVPEEPVSY